METQNQQKEDTPQQEAKDRAAADERLFGLFVDTLIKEGVTDIYEFADKAKKYSPKRGGEVITDLEAAYDARYQYKRGDISWDNYRRKLENWWWKTDSLARQMKHIT